MRRAFTLVECMTLISIFIFLAAIIIPSCRIRAEKSARKNAQIKYEKENQFYR